MYGCLIRNVKLVCREIVATHQRLVYRCLFIETLERDTRHLALDYLGWILFSTIY